MREAARIGRLCVITDTVTQTRFSHDELASLAIEGGADTIQLRDKLLADRELVRVARLTLQVCREHNVPLVINDRVDVARVTNADGVHLGLEDEPIADVRAVLGPHAIVGGTAGTLDEALAAEAAGATYVGFGHIFPTTSKDKPGAPVGLETLESVCAAVRIPVLAIGGIDETNVASVVGAGVWGVAVISAICGARDPREAARRLRAHISG